jgi:hypothetical protein
MKKAVLIVLAVVLLLPCFAWAGALDGVWWSPDLGTSVAFMIYEGFLEVFVVALNIPDVGSDFNYCALSGLDGVEINFQSIAYLCGVDLNATMSLISETSATVKINHCSLIYPGYSCNVPSSFNIEKLF